jgi:high-affinity nickel-transport protein
MKRQIAGLGVLLVVANLGCWLWAVLLFRHQPSLLGSALLAYGLGLRHAVDADHIAAIDNATRKLMQDGQNPLGVGLYFSLGHSSVVALLTLALVLTETAAEHQFGFLKMIGATLGSAVSTSVLLALGTINLAALPGLYRRCRGGGPDNGPGTGLSARMFSRVHGLVGRSWHLFPLGFLFGLGFDTATEIGVLSVSATSAADGMPIWGIMVFPALFSAGMALLDTADGVLMMGAYGWAPVQPHRKLRYNFFITLASALAALGIGLLEGLGLIAERFELTGTLWGVIERANQQLTSVGVALIGLFAVGWGLAALFNHLGLKKSPVPALSDVGARH